MEIITKSAEETFDFGQKTGTDLITQKSADQAIVLTLRGELGSGKTTFTQGFAKGLGIPSRILSPTFILLRRYELKTKNYDWLYHLDLYRLGGNTDPGDLGLSEIVADSRSIVAIEWPEKIQKFLPKKRIDLHFSSVNEAERLIKIVEYE
jgi:tRNA threonylcarbamoyladenosine biosynthesis protein TsaE